MVRTAAGLFREILAALIVAIVIPVTLLCFIVAGMKAEIWALNAHISHAWSGLLWLVFVAIILVELPQSICTRWMAVRCRAVYDIGFAVGFFGALLTSALVFGFFDNYGSFTGRSPSYRELLRQYLTAASSIASDSFAVLGWIPGLIMCLVVGSVGVAIGRAYWRKVQSRQPDKSTQH